MVGRFWDLSFNDLNRHPTHFSEYWEHVLHHTSKNAMKDLRSIVTAFLFEQPALVHPASNIGLLLARVYAGVTIMSAGLDKLPLPEWMVEQVITVGFPFPTFFAWLSSFSEFAFGLMLVFGLMTRISGIMLGITMGVAAFGFHRVLPLVDMHIAQHFFWMFIVFSTVGGGKYTIDYLIRKPGTAENTRWVYAAAPSCALILIFGLWLEFASPEPVPQERQVVISSINIPGSFNDWNPEANNMTQVSDTDYTLDIAFDAPGVIDFKFTANQTWDINLGVTEAQPAGFPISGVAALDEGNTTQNIRAYIPAAGQYRFSLNRQNFMYTLDSLSTP